MQINSIDNLDHGVVYGSFNLSYLSKKIIKPILHIKLTSAIWDFDIASWLIWLTFRVINILFS